MSLNKIKDANNIQCSHRVLSVIPNIDPTKLEHKRLDGVIQVSNTGSHANIAEVRCLCLLSEWEELLRASGDSSYIHVDFEGAYYDGIIRDVPQIINYVRGPRNTRIYHARFQMITYESG